MATGRSGSSPTREQTPSSVRRSRRSPAAPPAVPWRHCRDSSARFWACSQHQFASIGAARNGPSRRQISLTWLPKARRASTPMPPSRCTSTTRAILLRIASRWRARQQPRACPRPGMGRRKRQEQRAVCAVFLAQRVAHLPREPGATASSARFVVHPSMPGPATPAERPPTIVERALRHDRAPICGPPGPAARVLLDVDRRDGPRHVRTHDRRQCVDDDGGLGRTAPVAALGNVDRHDGGHDAPVGLTAGAPVRCQRATIRTRNGWPPDPCARSRLSGRLDGVQPRGDRASAWTRGAPARVTDDGGHQFPGRCDVAASRGRLSTDADQARVSANVPVPAGVPDEPMAQRMAWCVRHGRRARHLLRGLLLGADVAAVCRGRDEPDGHCRADRICRIRKTGALWRCTPRGSAACS